MSNGSVLVLIGLLIAGGIYYYPQLQNNNTTQCVTNSDCESVLNACFGQCNNGQCKKLDYTPTKPCQNAVWGGYPTCSFDTSQCQNNNQSSTQEIPQCTVSDTLWKCGTKTTCSNNFYKINCCEYQAPVG